MVISKGALGCQAGEDGRVSSNSVTCHKNANAIYPQTLRQGQSYIKMNASHHFPELLYVTSTCAADFLSDVDVFITLHSR